MPNFINDNRVGHSRRMQRKWREHVKAEINTMYIRCERQEAISKKLGVSQSFVSNTINEIRAESLENLKQYLTLHLPQAHYIAVKGIDAVIVSLWAALDEVNAQGDSAKVSDKTEVLGLLAHCYDQRLQMSADGSLVAEAMRQMEIVKQQFLALRPEQAALLETRIANYQTGGGIVTAEGEHRQEQVLRREQQQQLQHAQAQADLNKLIGKESISIEEENSDDESSLEGHKSSASLSDNNSFDEEEKDGFSSIQPQQKRQSSLSEEERNNEGVTFSLADNSSSRFEYGGNGHGDTDSEGVNRPHRPTQNRTF